MGEDPFAIQQAQERIDAAKRRSRLRDLGCTEKRITKLEDACELGNEIKGLHEPFKQWLHLHQILYVYADPTRKATIQSGTADFICLRFGAGCAVEFKALNNPEAGLSQDQKDWRAKADRAEVPYLLTNSLSEAIKFVTRELELSL